MPPKNIKVENPDYAPIKSAMLERAGYYDSLGDQSFETMNQLRKRALDKAAFGTDTPQAAIRQDVHGAINDVMESAAGPKGQQWRALGQDVAMGMRARDAAEKGATNEAKQGISKAELLGGVLGGPVGWAGARIMKGRGPSTMAAATELDAKGRGAAGAIGRALDKTAAPVGGAVGRSIMNVQKAAEEDPEEAAKAHFLESSKNPEYRDYTHRTE